MFEDLSADWRHSLGLEKKEPEPGEEFYQELYDSISSTYATNANHAYSLMTKYRKKSFDTAGKTDATYKYYEIMNVGLSSIGSNENIRKLYYLQKDEEILKAINNGKFVIAHTEVGNQTATIPFEYGNEQVPVILKDNVIDMPLVQEEALYIIKRILEHDKIKNASISKVHFKSGVRVNDTRS
ncbi:hypothetical protein [Paraclostridium dentum]|uniref:hypothetical protein n=1 Tax=Paraclostridium dentum TaxID=2662455 RepID=UPI003F30E833